MLVLRTGYDMRKSLLIWYAERVGKLLKLRLRNYIIRLVANTSISVKGILLRCSIIVCSEDSLHTMGRMERLYETYSSFEDSVDHLNDLVA